MLYGKCCNVLEIKEYMENVECIEYMEYVDQNWLHFDLKNGL